MVIGRKTIKFLEFLGDAVLEYLSTRSFIENFCLVNSSNQMKISNFKTVGILSNKRSFQVCNDNLASYEDKLGLWNYLISSENNTLKKRYDKKIKKGDLIESVLGAVAVDSNYNFEVITQVYNKIVPESSVKESELNVKELVNKEFENLEKPFYLNYSINGVCRCWCFSKVYNLLFCEEDKDDETAKAKADMILLDAIKRPDSEPVSRKKTFEFNSITFLNLLQARKKIPSIKYEIDLIESGNTSKWKVFAYIGDGKLFGNGLSTDKGKARKKAGKELLLKIYEKSRTFDLISAGEIRGKGLLKYILSKYRI